MKPSHCADLAEPNIPVFSLSVFIVFGILISYLPQHLRIITRRSSEGLSPYFVLLGTTSSTFAIANILTLPASQADIGCCHEISRFACIAGLLGIAQVAVQWGCFSLMYVTDICVCKASSNGPRQHAPIPRLLPNPRTRRTPLGCTTTAFLERRTHRRPDLCRAFRCRSYNIRGLPAVVPQSFTVVGDDPRPLRRNPSLHTIHSTALDNMATATRHELEYTYDVYTDTWQLCIRHESRHSFGLGRMECMGRVHRHWHSAGLFTIYGDSVRT
jgi:hypothetical protein